ncbi:MAG TPA: TetR/AcrR family transcriptional regulator [Pseudolysinimonas sp.]
MTSCIVQSIYDERGLMTAETRSTMVAGAARLLAERGLQATSFSEVLAATGAPRGSLYHHFPDGKDQLVAAAVELAGDRAVAYLDAQHGADAVEITRRFLHIWREVLIRSDYRAGCAVLAVTVATDSPELHEHTAGVFRRWRGRLSELLQDGGLGEQDAARFATTLVASSEGAVVLSRADRSLEPFELVADQLLEQAELLMSRGR